ncbi:MAG: type II secretion system GspH family protein [Candidatus Omnitrophica bacterium]|nr:type II secretion system GspH family protein [Candidatus Omnitrophota bacterium]
MGKIKKIIKLTIESDAFTIVEMLVVVTILGFLVLVGTNIFLNTLKSKKKTESWQNIKQSGDYALLVMTNKIRNALEINNCSDDGYSLTLVNGDRTTSSFVCDPVNNHALVFDDYNLISNYLISCHFDCNLSAFPPVVKISFTLATGNPQDINSYASQDFSTTVSLRAYR